MKVFLGVHVDFTARGDNGVQGLHGGRGQLTQQLWKVQRKRAQRRAVGTAFVTSIRQEQVRNRVEENISVSWPAADCVTL